MVGGRCSYKLLRNLCPNALHLFMPPDTSDDSSRSYIIRASTRHLCIVGMWACPRKKLFELDFHF